MVHHDEDFIKELIMFEKKAFIKNILRLEILKTQNGVCP